ncbi:MAG: hypothetical protein SGARI_006658, partial [Bacillariaceae sp.]
MNQWRISLPTFGNTLLRSWKGLFGTRNQHSASWRRSSNTSPNKKLNRHTVAILWRYRLDKAFCPI